MNNNQLTEKALRDVFETTSYINIGTEDAPLQYNLKPPVRSCHNGKQFITNPGKPGKTLEVYFQKEHPWISDGDGFVDHLKYKDVQEQRFKGFLDSDFSRRDEFSNTLRTGQYREQLKMEEKHAKRSLKLLAENIAQSKKLESEERYSTRSLVYWNTLWIVVV
ncbi:hypothetical protein O6H91_01G026500 [Diphasiastrum complanatum]|uniref:Uncharacterized protein n=1 Tax=Diphasiastrum complanatum TaxID=34168 RepID=A0ACC2EPF8_DIPCM|nr:hypothetical protein O6H91_01G026500 [Diphasiastrum complanatum]